MDLKSNKIGKMRPEGRPHGIFGGRTSEEVGQAKALELANSASSILARFVPRVGGGLMGYRLFRRPPSMWYESHKYSMVSKYSKYSMA